MMASVTITSMIVPRDAKGGIGGKIVVKYGDGITQEFPNLAAVIQEIGDVDSLDFARRIALRNALTGDKANLDAAQVVGKAVVFDARASVAEVRDGL